MNLDDRVRIRISELNLTWLSRYPVWSWFPSSLFESEDQICPVDLRKDNLSRLHTLFVSAVFTTVEGLQLYGSVSLDLGNQKVYEIELFDGDENFGFNSKLPDLAQTQLDSIKAFYDSEHMRIFPVSYRTLANLCLANFFTEEAVLSGTFSLRAC